MSRYALNTPGSTLGFSRKKRVIPDTSFRSSIERSAAISSTASGRVIPPFDAIIWKRLSIFRRFCLASSESSVSLLTWRIISEKELESSRAFVIRSSPESLPRSSSDVSNEPNDLVYFSTAATLFNAFSRSRRRSTERYAWSASSSTVSVISPRLSIVAPVSPTAVPRSFSSTSRFPVDTSSRVSCFSTSGVSEASTPVTRFMLRENSAIAV